MKFLCREREKPIKLIFHFNKINQPLTLYNNKKKTEMLCYFNK